jgi:hypothetical protein
LNPQSVFHRSIYLVGSNRFIAPAVISLAKRRNKAIAPYGSALDAIAQISAFVKLKLAHCASITAVICILIVLSMRADLPRRAQSLYCANSLAKARRKPCPPAVGFYCCLQ